MTNINHEPLNNEIIYSSIQKLTYINEFRVKECSKIETLTKLYLLGGFFIFSLFSLFIGQIFSIRYEFIVFFVIYVVFIFSIISSSYLYHFLEKKHYENINIVIEKNFSVENIDDMLQFLETNKILLSKQKRKQLDYLMKEIKKALQSKDNGFSILQLLPVLLKIQKKVKLNDNHQESYEIYK